MKRFTTSIIIIILVIAGYIFFHKKSQENSLTSVKDIIIAPSPSPFVEMTIPYLRDRSYESNLAVQTLLSK